MAVAATYSLQLQQRLDGLAVLVRLVRLQEHAASLQFGARRQRLRQVHGLVGQVVLDVLSIYAALELLAVHVEARLAATVPHGNVGAQVDEKDADGDVVLVGVG